MALSDKNILITPSVGAATDPTIRFVGADASSSATITLRVLNTGTVGTLSFEGSSGQLFSLSDTMVGTIFSVNDVSGIPSIEVLDTGEIRMAQYGGFVDILSTINATTTNSGALQVVGGVGIGGNLYVGGTINGTIVGSITGIATTATNIAGGTAGQVHYQTAPGLTGFYGPGTAGQILLSAGAAAPVYTNTSSIFVGAASSAVNIFGGTTGQLHYQSAAGVTAFAGPGTAGQLLVSAGAAAPVYTNTASIYVGAATSAVNLFGGTAGQIHYQSAAGATAFAGPGTAGQLLVSAGAAAPVYTSTASIYVQDSNVSTNIRAGLAGQIHYQSAPNTTAFVSSGTSGQFLQATTNGAPVWTNTGSMYVNRATIADTANSIIGTVTTATNIAGGTAGQLHYQSAPNTTAFAGPGTAGQLLVSAGAAAPVYTNTASIFVGAASSAANLFGGSAGQFAYQTSAGATAFISTGSMYVNRATIADSAAGSSAQVNTTAQPANATYYPTFVDANNASAAAESVFTTSSFVINPGTGFVGIGGSPSAPLQVNTSNANAYSAYFSSAIGTTKLGNGARAALVDFGNGGGVFSNWYYNSTIDKAAIAGYSPRITLWNTDGSIRFESSGNLAQDATIGWSERMRIDTTGSVYLGTTAQLNPGFTNRLNVNGAIVAGDASSTNGSTILQGYYGTGATTVIGTNRSSGGALIGYGVTPSVTTSNNFLSSTGISLTRSATILDDSIRWYTAPATTTAIGGVVALTERMRITNAGGISFGASGTAVGSAGQLLQSNGDAAPTWVNASGLSSGQVNTVAQPGNATYYPAFVDSNNASSTAESLFTTSTFFVNPGTKVVGIGSSTVYTTFGYNSSYGYMLYNGVGTSFHYFSGAGLVSNSVFIGESNVYARGNLGNDAGLVLTVTGGTTTKTYINGILTVGSTATTSGEKLAVAGGVYVNGTVTATTFVGAFSGSITGAATQVNTIAQPGNATYFPTFVDSNNASSTGELVYTTSSFSINAATGRVDATGLVSTLAGYRNTGDYFEKVFANSIVFPNGVANQAADIRIGNTFVWGYIEVEINSSWNNQNSTGKLTKVFALGANPTNLIYTNESRIVDSMGPISENIAIGEFQWDGAATTYKIPVSHIVSTGNTYTIKVRCFGFNTGADTVLANTTISSVYTLTALSAHDGPYYNGNLMVGYTARQSGARLSINGGTFINGTVTATNFVGNITGTITGAATQVNTTAQPGNATYYPTFVDTNNASAAAESVFTTSSFVINPSTGNVGIGTAAPLAKLEVSGAASTAIKVTTSGGNGIFRGYEIGAAPGDAGIYGSIKMEPQGGELRIVAGYSTWGGYQTFYTNGTERLRLTSNGGVAFGGGSNFGTSGQILRSNGDLPPTWVNPTGTPVAIQEFTATGGQTTFTVTGGYTVGTVQVFANGIQLANADFTASNGTTVVVATPRVNGDIIRTVTGLATTTINNINALAIAYSVAFGA